MAKFDSKSLCIFAVLTLVTLVNFSGGKRVLGDSGEVVMHIDILDIDSDDDSDSIIIGSEETSLNRYNIKPTEDQNDDWVQNCGSDGEIAHLRIPNCPNFPACTLFAGEDVTLEYTYVTDKAFSNLNFQLSLVEVENGDVFPLKFTPSSSPVEANRPYESYARVALNSTIPNGKAWLMEILRSLHGKEVCARFAVEVINNLSSTTTELESSTAVTEPATKPTTESSEFECTEEGLFADTKDCTIFHDCQLLMDGTMWDTVLHCPEYTVWCQELQRCEFSLVCPCEIRRFYTL